MSAWFDTARDILAPGTGKEVRHVSIERLDVLAIGRAIGILKEEERKAWAMACAFRERGGSESAEEVLLTHDALSTALQLLREAHHGACEHNRRC
jgi:hypothetical protein